MSESTLNLWNDSAAREAIVAFVARTTTAGSADYLEPDDRIAVFDNDGTLWVESPVYTQLLFALDRVKATAADHPEWADSPIMAAALNGDMKTLGSFGLEAAEALTAASHASINIEDLAQKMREWLATATDGRFGKRYTELVYQPQLELMDYLRSNGYRVFITSGGGVEFIRVFAEELYGVPPDQVIGSTMKTVYEVRDGRGVLVQQPAIDFIDDGPGKPVAINKFIGRHPVIAVGNSDGDFEMLEYTTTGEGPRLGVLIHHDDAGREYAYDRESLVGRLERGLDEAEDQGWVLVSMKNDWSRIFAHESE